MPSYLDLALIGVVLISAILSMIRGFTREVLAIVSWGAAAAAAYYLYPYALPYVKPYIQKDMIALGVSAAGVFLVALVLVSIITVKISDVILDSKIGALDRSLGFVFGAARGFMLAVIAFLFFGWLVPEKQQPEWVKTARTRPILQSTGDQIMALLPDDPESYLNKLKKQRPGFDAPVEPDPGAPATAPVAPIPPARKTEIVPPIIAPAAAATAPAAKTTPSPTDKQKLDALLNGTPPKPR